MHAEALALLQQRSSAGKLTAPAPDALALDAMFRAAVRAPDHARLQPWRFIVIEGEGRNALGELFVRVQEQKEGVLPEEKRQKLANNPLRAPLIVVVVAKHIEHPKVPACEQQLSAACAAHAILLAAEAQGYAGIWRTGDIAYEAGLCRGLGLQLNENVIGFLYLGSRQGEAKLLEPVDVSSFVEVWPG